MPDWPALKQMTTFINPKALFPALPKHPLLGVGKGNEEQKPGKGAHNAFPARSVEEGQFPTLLLIALCLAASNFMRVQMPANNNNKVRFGPLTTFSSIFTAFFKLREKTGAKSNICAEQFNLPLRCSLNHAYNFRSIK